MQPLHERTESFETRARYIKMIIQNNRQSMGKCSDRGDMILEGMDTELTQ